MFTRYALYYTPPPGPLATALAGWLGWDPATGTEHVPPALPGLPRPAAAITARPRKYGAHGTLKAPFALAPESDATSLERAVVDFAASRAPARFERLALTRLGGFLALTPRGDVTAPDALAADILRHFDDFRALPAEQDLARRRQSRLSDRQEANLLRWGYPHVLEDFRFHITLTGPLKPGEDAAIATALEAHLAPLLPAPFPLDAISLLGEDAGTGRFHLICRVPFTGPAISAPARSGAIASEPGPSQGPAPSSGKRRAREDPQMPDVSR